MKINTVKKVLPVLIISAVFMSGCQLTGKNPVDPYEPLNRKVYSFNQSFDKILLKPVAKVYTFVFPAFVRQGVTNFFNNFHSPSVVANDLLQGNIQQASKNTVRFLINSTAGVAGIFDVAKNMDLEYRPNDLGVTFGKWGDTNSPYVVMPFLGPSTIRDSFGRTFDNYAFSFYPHIPEGGVRWGIRALLIINTRANLFEAEKLLTSVALDPYALMRDAYLQNRKHLIFRGTDQEASDEDDPYVEARASDAPSVQSETTTQAGS